MSLTQFEYYQQHGLRPNQTEVEDPSVFARHYQIRNHLYQNLLRLPPSLLSGKDVLDVGCGTGENPLVLALQGARVSLVDADPTVGSRINGLFDHFGVAERIRQMTFSSLEEYEDDPIFSLVIAEGFIYTLPNCDEMLAKLCSLIQPGGFGIVSFNDRFGSFFEVLKKAIMWRAYQIGGIQDIQSQPALDIARQLFDKGHQLLPNPREFSVWWKDEMLSPFLTWDDHWAYDEILEILAKEGCSFYSSSPRLYEPPHLTWYKALQSPAEIQAAVLRSSALRKFDFLFGEPVGATVETEALTQLSDRVGWILKDLSNYFRSLDQPVPDIDFEPVATLFEGAGIEHDSLAEMVEFFRLLRTDSLPELLDAYASLGQLSLRWGCLYHYLCFTKDANIPA